MMAGYRRASVGLAALVAVTLGWGSAVRATVVNESEPNDFAAQANEIAVGDTVRATFSSTGDADWFVFEWDSTKMYYLTSIENAQGVAPDLQLFYESDTTQNILTTSVAGRNGQNNFRLSGYVPARSGRYYAKIVNAGTAAGGYKLRLVGGRTLTELQVHEPDNDYVAALRHHGLDTNGDTLMAAIYPNNDVDIYWFQATAGQTVRVFTCPVLDLDIRDTDTFMELLDPLGRVIAQNDDRGNEATSSGPRNNTFSAIEKVIPANGRYYVRVRCYYNEDAGTGPINENRPGTGEYGISLWLGTPPPKPMAFEKRPYLQNVKEDGITIMWETTQPADSKVEYGPDTTYGQVVYDSSLVKIHEVRIKGLDPQTTYHYRVLSDTLVSPDATFRTAIYVSTPFRFTVWGDSRTDTASHGRVVRQMVRWHPDIAVNTGDVVTNGDVYQQWSDEFFSPAWPLMRNTPVYVSIGNHEGNAHWFYDFFSFPPPEDYFSFNYGNAHFIILDTNKPYYPGSAQYNWLDADLKSPERRKATWTFVFFHHPPWSQQWDSPGYSGESGVRRDLVPLLEREPHVDFVFNGHTHDYERGLHNGVYYIITGGGGAALDRVKTGDWPHIAIWLSQYHFCVVDVNGNDLVFQAVSVHGTLLDSLHLHKSASGVVASQGSPATPTTFGIKKAYPNPFQGKTRLTLQLPAAGTADVLVTDVLGRVVRHLKARATTGGVTHVLWDGRDQAGRLVPAGVYFAVARWHGRQSVVKMLRIE